jgi:membrane protein DedA with SNARE-associated domain
LDFVFDWLTQFLSQPNHPAGLAILVVSAATEYLFPPFPGDTVTLLGGVLVSAYDWSVALAFSAVVLGSQIGAMATFYLGQHLQRPRDATATKDSESAIARLVLAFEKRGAWCLVLNRFVPGVRPFFFVAAGLAGMKPLAVFGWSARSSALWTALLFAVGMTIGHNLDQLELWGQRYATIVGAAVCLALILFAARAAQRRRRSR